MTCSDAIYILYNFTSSLTEFAFFKHFLHNTVANVYYPSLVSVKFTKATTYNDFKYSSAKIQDLYVFSVM